MSTMLETTLFWQHKGLFSRDYNLLADEQVVGEFHLHGWFTKQGMAVWGNQRWDFVRKGWVNRVTYVTHNSNPDPIGEFRENFWGTDGKLILTDGATFHLKRASFWGNNIGWFFPNGEPVLRFHNKGFWGNKVYVEMVPNVLSDFHVQLLVTTGWFLQVLRWQDQQNNTASTSSSASMIG